MKILKPFSIKTIISTGLAVTLLGTSVGCAVVGSGYDNYPVYGGNDDYGNADYNRISQKLRADLRRKGYQVMDIKSDNYRGNRIMTAYAKKNNQAYELKYTYPDLKLISSNKKAWSNVWQDDRYDNDHYKKDKYKIMASIRIISTIKMMISKIALKETRVIQQLSNVQSIKYKAWAIGSTTLSWKKRTDAACSRLKPSAARKNMKYDLVTQT
ncbi:hypothetical protein [Psychrobacter sp. WY6]|uniref:hypothetical protein n=1 Tax=Psychrobacter sp. WY6 TaxID=2708350 RepID=UPI002022D9C9|nr:hypothetical protein [Psychrobacter sp. WY6]